jgi:hypothetical protein
MRNGIGSVVNRTMKRNSNKETAPDPTASNANSQPATTPQQPPPKQQQAPDKDSKDKNGVRKTKPTHEEATLTAKNYRLAKELVRYVTLFITSALLLRDNLLIIPSIPFLTHFDLPLIYFRLRLTSQSELRVRHREECKNVTKLTMENVSKRFWMKMMTFFSFASDEAQLSNMITFSLAYLPHSTHVPTDELGLTLSWSH